MNIHKTHNVLGNYCWDCQRPTKRSIPYWPGGPEHSDKFAGSKAPIGFSVKPAKYIGRNPYDCLTSIVWANGDIVDTKTGVLCADCGRPCVRRVEKEFKWGIDPYNSVFKRNLQ